MIFPSKVDGWIAVVLVVTGAIVSFASLKLILAGALLPGTVVFISAVLIALSVYPTYYQFTPERLVIHSGWLRWSIRYCDIIDLKPSDDLRASPALSTDRIEVAYYTKRSHIRTVLISPRDADMFIAELSTRQKASPNLQ
jgi:hypothetical protein